MFLCTPRLLDATLLLVMTGCRCMCSMSCRQPHISKTSPQMYPLVLMGTLISLFCSRSHLLAVAHSLGAECLSKCQNDE